VYVAVLMMLAAQSLDVIDDANLALTTCGFETFREADRQDRSLAQFRQMLDDRCAGKMARMRELAVGFDMSRKRLSRSAAKNAAAALIDDFRGRFATQYSNRDETRAQLKALERAMRNKGEPNAE
jgi:hypothetical protein